jgi:hypothetical protein
MNRGATTSCRAVFLAVKVGASPGRISTYEPHVLRCGGAGHRRQQFIRAAEAVRDPEAEAVDNDHRMRRPHERLAREVACGANDVRGHGMPRSRRLMRVPSSGPPGLVRKRINKILCDIGYAAYS